ncbi:hypothetical protein M3Y98_00034900 [Aphelenchoides besseyi]|nr:hypothetical protein M3Y98_00034900 [Aphelenchoides besseyi]
MSKATELQMKIQARAILLEQFNENVTDHHVAFKVVCNELGPQAITERISAYWFKEFKKENFSLGSGSISKSDKELLKDGTFLERKRSLFCEIQINDVYYKHLKVTGLNGRYQFFLTTLFDRPNWMIDTFHGIKQQLLIDVSQIRPRDPNDTPFAEGKYNLRNIHFIDSGRILVIALVPKKGNFLFSGTFDIMTCSIKLGEYRRLSIAEQYSFLADSQSVGLLKNRSKSFDEYTAINTNDVLNFENRTQLGSNLYLKFATVRGQTLIGFNKHLGLNLSLLVTVSLTDGTFTTRDVKFVGLDPYALTYYQQEHVWIKDWLFIHTFDDNMNEIYGFDLKNMVWKKTEIRLGGTIERMSASDEEMLIVNVTKYKSSCQEIYRFPISKPHSLESLVWRATRRRAQCEPEIVQKKNATVAAQFSYSLSVAKRSVDVSFERRSLCCKLYFFTVMLILFFNTIKSTS